MATWCCSKINVLPAGVCWMRISKDVAAREIDVVEIHVKT